MLSVFGGLANAASPAIVDCRLRLRELFTALSKSEHPNAVPGKRKTRDPLVSHAALRNLKWWASLSQNPHIGRLLWPSADVCVFKYASMAGWGAA